jgi:hypothetical protein
VNPFGVDREIADLAVHPTHGGLVDAHIVAHM